MACYKISTINTPGATLNLVIPKGSLTIRNGERACFCLATDVPASTSVLPVYFEIGGATVPLYDLLGNTLYADQISCGKVIPGVWGTNPLHFKLCSCVEGRSQATEASATIPAA